MEKEFDMYKYSRAVLEINNNWDEYVRPTDLALLVLNLSGHESSKLRDKMCLESFTFQAEIDTDICLNLKKFGVYDSLIEIVASDIMYQVFLMAFATSMKKNKESLYQILKDVAIIYKNYTQRSIKLMSNRMLEYIINMYIENETGSFEHSYYAMYCNIRLKQYPLTVDMLYDLEELMGIEYPDCIKVLLESKPT